MQIVVVECEVCEKEFEIEDNSVYFEHQLCASCYHEWPVIIDCDIENKIQFLHISTRQFSESQERIEQ